MAREQRIPRPRIGSRLRRATCQGGASREYRDLDCFSDSIRDHRIPLVGSNCCALPGWFRHSLPALPAPRMSSIGRCSFACIKRATQRLLSAKLLFSINNFDLTIDTMAP
jgi:hypothetical protein